MALENTQITEGSARIVVPQKSFSDPHHCEVFYNPAMQFNRSLSTLFLEASLTYCNISALLLFDGFTATGIRGIRYLKESGVEKAVFCDAGDATIPYLKKNLSLNKIPKSKAAVLHMDVNQGLSNSPVFDVVELDPFGSPLPFLDSAFRRGKKKFILSLTFTDLANLCGGHVDACKRYYNAQSIHCAFSHELAMRIILARVAKSASMYDFGITPLVSWYEGHYVKTMLLCEKSAARADKNFQYFGSAWLCRKCLARGIADNERLSCSCGGELKFAGPLWKNSYSNKEIIAAAIELVSKKKFYSEKEREKLRNFLELLLTESGEPLFYELGELCQRRKVQVPKLSEFVEKLNNEGFKATKTHFSPYGVKTNATISQLSFLLML